MVIDIFEFALFPLFFFLLIVACSMVVFFLPCVSLRSVHVPLESVGRTWYVQHHGSIIALYNIQRIHQILQQTVNTQTSFYYIWLYYFLVQAFPCLTFSAKFKYLYYLRNFHLRPIARQLISTARLTLHWYMSFRIKFQQFICSFCCPFNCMVVFCCTCTTILCLCWLILQPIMFNIFTRYLLFTFLCYYLKDCYAYNI